MRVIRTIRSEDLPTYRFTARCVHDNCGIVDQADSQAEAELVAIAHLRQTGHAAVDIEDRA